jgi:hypothetical protein
MYEQLSDEELAKRVSEELGLSYKSALRALRSEDPALGRDWAIAMLQGSEQHAARQQRLSDHRRALLRVGTLS